MCRALAYVGEPLLLDDVLFEADSSLVRQATDPKLMMLLTSAASVWRRGTPARPSPSSRSSTARRRSRRSTATSRRWPRRCTRQRSSPTCAALVYDPGESVGPQNLHPFRFPGARVALAQNGDLAGFGAMRFDLLEHVRPELAAQIGGTTDTEWIYALVLSQLERPLDAPDPDELAEAVRRSLTIVRRARERRGIAVQSPINLVISDGSCLIATRFVYDYGWYLDDDSFFAGEREYDFTSLWYTTSGADVTTSITVASEPLTSDRSEWLEAPAYSKAPAR
jgi:glutamine amidotransferase